jgi:hypothetical protein
VVKRLGVKLAGDTLAAKEANQQVPERKTPQLPACGDGVERSGDATVGMEDTLAPGTRHDGSGEATCWQTSTQLNFDTEAEMLNPKRLN